MADADRWVSLGRLGRAHGVRGWCWIRSDCDPAEALFDYVPLRLRLGSRELILQIEQQRQMPKGLLAKIAGFDTPEAVQAWAGALIETLRSALPDGDGWYWTDLEGLRVCNQDGLDLGRVSHLFDAGGGAVMVVQGERERLLPFVMDQVVRHVDLAAKRIDVDWDADF